MKKLNLLIVSNQPYPVGMAGTTRIKLFAENLASRGHLVTVIVTVRSEINSLSNGQENQVNYFHLGPKSNSLLNYLIYFLGFVKVLNTLRKLYKYDYFNSILLYDGVNVDNFLFSSFGRKAGYIIISDIVEDYSLSAETMSILHMVKKSFNSLFDNNIRHFVDGVVIISRHLEKKYIGKVKMVKLIPVSASNLAFKSKSVTRNDSDIIFLYSGTYGKKDGVEDLIEAFNSLNKINPKIKLVLAGRMKPHINRIIAKTDNPCIIMKGFIAPDLYFDFLNSADILCMTRINSPYANAGFPFKLGEFLATGKPVITTDVSDISFYLEDKKDAVFARPSDIESLKNAFYFLLSNQDMWEKIGSNGKSKAELFFNPKKNGDKLTEFLYQIHYQHEKVNT